MDCLSPVFKVFTPSKSLSSKDLAQRVIRSGMKVAAAEGAGFGLGGLITIVPDLGILSAVTLRTIQKLSLIYGFEFNTEEETAELWIAAATAAGVDISRELLEKEVVSRFVPRVIQRIAAQASVGSSREMVGAADSFCELSDRRRPELLFRAGMGGACTLAFPQEAYGDSRGRMHEGTLVEGVILRRLCPRKFGQQNLLTAKNAKLAKNCFAPLRTLRLGRLF